ncbi:MAG: hypothetical protein IPG99_20615 [Ignavibacteria bacterium]|nr:hypothetical protein [Ignavibacteria bacterium]
MSFEIKANSFVKLIIYDISGREINNWQSNGILVKEADMNFYLMQKDYRAVFIFISWRHVHKTVLLILVIVRK